MARCRRARSRARALPTWRESAEAFRRRDRGAGMSVSRRLAGAARALRPARAQRRRARCGRRPRSPTGRRCTIVDLACGTGSTLRALTPRLPAPGRTGGWSTTTSACWRARRELVAAGTSPSRPCRSISTAISKRRSTGRSIWSPPRRCSISSRTNGWSGSRSRPRRGALPVYAALSYDGRDRARRRPMPLDADDHRRGQRASAHRQGLRSGARAGGGAARASSASSASAIRWCRARPIGCSAPTDREIQTEMLTGWAAAAREIGDVPLGRRRSAWLARRRDLVAAGRSSIRVGHVDFFARPTAHALSRQVAVEQHLVVEPVHAHRRPQRLVDARDRRQRRSSAGRSRG